MSEKSELKALLADLQASQNASFIPIQKEVEALKEQHSFLQIELKESLSSHLKENAEKISRIQFLSDKRNFTQCLRKMLLHPDTHFFITDGQFFENILEHFHPTINFDGVFKSSLEIFADKGILAPREDWELSKRYWRWESELKLEPLPSTLAKYKFTKSDSSEQFFARNEKLDVEELLLEMDPLDCDGYHEHDGYHETATFKLAFPFVRVIASDEVRKKFAFLLKEKRNICDGKVC